LCGKLRVVMKTRHLLAVAVNLGAALLAVLAFGVWERLNPVDLAKVRFEGSITRGFYDQNVDDVGFITAANRRVTARALAGDRVLYDVVYTTGSDHFRVVPAATHPERCVLLFGDSFTFGIGVNDDETFAAQIVAKSKGTVEVKNLAAGGWGPHQFLAGLQTGLFQRAVSCRPTDAVYLLIRDHVERAVGRVPWDPHGPRFRLGADGQPVRDGHFDGGGGAPRAWTEAEANELTAVLLEEGGRELQRKYPGIRFHVLTWAGVSEAIRRRLGGRPLEESIPGYTDEGYLIPIDGHPNARAHERIADYVLSLL
jgi:hypothetical protein